MAEEHSTHTTRTTDTARTEPVRETTTTTTTHTETGRSTGLIVGILVAVLLVIAWLFLAGESDDVTPADVDVDATPGADATPPADVGDDAATDTTEVIEPGAADGGADVPITTEENEAGTEADTAIEADPAPTTNN